jgi:hypothetical protein
MIPLFYGGPSAFWNNSTGTAGVVGDVADDPGQVFRPGALVPAAGAGAGVNPFCPHPAADITTHR